MKALCTRAALVAAALGFLVTGHLAANAAQATTTPPTAPATAPAATPAGAPALVSKWPQARSDLKADPAVRFGVLPNGMRYAIMKNATPEKQVSLRLRIGSGSL